MPTDTKRLPVPEESTPPIAFAKNNEETENILIDSSGHRKDGRSCDQARPLFVKCGVVTQAKGSAYLELNKTKVMCAVYGPREVKRKEDFSMKGQLHCEIKFATFSCRLRRQHLADNQEKDYSVVLLEALEPAVCLDKFPKAKLDIFVTVLENDGCALAAAISCASMALTDAGVEMYDIVIGCTVRQHEQHILIDPCEDEEYKSQFDAEYLNNGSVTLGLMPSLNQVAALVQKGEMEHEVVVQALKTCVETCQKIYPVLQQCILKSVKQKVQTETEKMSS